MRRAHASAVSALLLLGACSVLIDTDPSALGAGPGGDGEPVDPACAQACDDGIPCTIDDCDGELGCVHQPDNTLCDDGVGCTEDLCNVQLGCSNEPRDDRCEFCAPGSHCDVDVGGCLGATTLRDCADDDPCTADICSVAELACTNKPVDDDEDGFPARNVGEHACGGNDCDDTAEAVYPGAAEVCDGKDNDCDGNVDEQCEDLPDSCSGVEPLELVAGEAMLEGSLAPLAADYPTPCGETSARDAVYRLRIDAVSDIVLDSMGSDTPVVLAASSMCQSDSFTRVCAGPMAEGRSRLAVHRYDPAVLGNDLYLLVKGTDEEAQGAYRVHVRVSPAAEDSCDGAIDHRDCGTLVGFMPTSSPPWTGQSGSCRGLFGNIGEESLVRVRGAADGRLALSVKSESFAPTMFVRTGCGLGTRELECATAQDGFSSTGMVQFEIELGASEEALVVIDDGSPVGMYTLTCQ